MNTPSMIKSRWFYHPLFIFIFSLIALGSSLIIYIRSYLRVNAALEEVVFKYHLNAKSLMQTQTWVLILILSLLVAVILAGLLIIYIYYQKMIQLYRLQQNFINGFTHELKTPIASLQLFLETFARHELPRDEQLKYLEYMRRDTVRLADNVNRILNLGRLEDRNFKADFTPQDLVVLIEEFLDNTPHLFEEGKVSFHSDLQSFILPIDTALFEMLLMNLITNALIYNKSKEKRVDIKLSKIGSTVLLDFKDNGMGLEKNQIKKIFKKFYQVGKSSKGSGLGLYIVYNIVKLHRGEIHAFSKGVGEGSLFRVSFKIQESK
ncbi:MAG: HAMP domain-containing sensor histidine kinase [Bacteriovorax sp.]|nr:HAMP domain-containing sensor histidine kinase [Bacteriovorax sp.]